MQTHPLICLPVSNGVFITNVWLFNEKMEGTDMTVQGFKVIRRKYPGYEFTTFIKKNPESSKVQNSGYGSINLI